MSTEDTTILPAPATDDSTEKVDEVIADGAEEIADASTDDESALEGEEPEPLPCPKCGPGTGAYKPCSVECFKKDGRSAEDFEAFCLEADEREKNRKKRANKNERADADAKKAIATAQAEAKKSRGKPPRAGWVFRKALLSCTVVGLNGRPQRIEAGDEGWVDPEHGLADHFSDPDASASE